MSCERRTWITRNACGLDRLRRMTSTPPNQPAQQVGVPGAWVSHTMSHVISATTLGQIFRPFVVSLSEIPPVGTQRTSKSNGSNIDFYAELTTLALCAYRSERLLHFHWLHLGDRMMREYSGDRAVFTSVHIDSPTAVRVLLTNADARVEVINGVEVSFVRSRYTLDDLVAYAHQIHENNSTVASVEVQADIPELRAGVLPEDGGTLARVFVPSVVPDGIKVVVVEATRELPAAAEGARHVTGNGCTSGFRMNTNRISTASHCGTTWGTVNGTSVTNRSNRCVIDNRWGSASSISLTISGYGWWGGQYDPANGATVQKYGRMTGWTYGNAGNYSTSQFPGSCVVSVQRYSGGNIASIGGDSGGPYLTLEPGSPATYVPRGTHRGSSSGYIIAVPISAINAQGWYVQ